MVQGLPHIRVAPVDHDTEVCVQIKDLLRVDRADRLLIIPCVQRIIILQAVPALGGDRQDILRFFEMDILPLPVKDWINSSISAVSRHPKAGSVKPEIVTLRVT